MRRLTVIFALLFVLLAVVSPSRARPQASSVADADATLTQDRFVVFEAFMRST